MKSAEAKFVFQTQQNKTCEGPLQAIAAQQELVSQGLAATKVGCLLRVQPTQCCSRSSGNGDVMIQLRPRGPHVNAAGEAFQMAPTGPLRIRRRAGSYVLNLCPQLLPAAVGH